MKHVAPTEVYVIATQHLDVAWLWNRVPHGEELMRMVFELALDLSVRRPEARFVMSRSTVWGYHIVERKHPELFVRVKKAVEEGRIELCGGQWVEPDNLIPSGESQIRQGLYGQLYYRSRFGKTATVAWNPDVFGHGNGLPQIYRQVGLSGYYSHRMPPTDDEGREIGAFVWEGPAGSQVLAFSGNWYERPDASTIEALFEGGPVVPVPVQAVVVGRRSDRRMTITEDWLPLPARTKEELGLEECRWAGADEVFRALEKRRKDLPVIAGDLGGYSYTGTYTSDQITKRYNRRLENRLAAAELLNTWSFLNGGAYHKALLTEAWRDLCLNQFHDIICGTCYQTAQEEAHRLYRTIDGAAESAIHYAVDNLSSRIDCSAQPGVPLIVFNSGPIAVEDLVTIEAPGDGPWEVRTAEGEALAVQRGPVPALEPPTAVPGVADSGRERNTALRLRPAPIPPLGYRVFYVNKARQEIVTRDDELVLQNELMRVEIDPSYGSIISLVDKSDGFEYVAERGRFNRIVTYEDKNDYSASPDHLWDPWYIKLTGKEHDPHGAYTVSVVENGPVAKTIRMVRRFSVSSNRPDAVIIQDMTLAAGSPILSIRCYGEWHGEQACVKAEFDTSFAAETVVCEMPYATIERSASMDGGRHIGREAAEDAVTEGEHREEPDRPMQMWLDFAGKDRGLAILNNGKYGYDSQTHRVRLSLMRAPFIRKGEVAGLGPFDFSYALYPHRGGFQEAGVAERALAFNRDPVVAFSWPHEGELPATGSLFTVDVASVHIIAVKQAELGADVVIRLYETRGKATRVRLTAAYPIARALWTTALEDPQGAETVAVVDGRSVDLDFRGGEIKTLRLWRRA